jgi:hypothetical protein
MQNKRYSLSEIYLNEPETRIKISDVNTGQWVIYSLSQKAEIESYFEYFISYKDIHAIGILQGIELAKPPLPENKIRTEC